ncbi:MAG TPA: cardiolipin synthase [Usitatibacteraceae bacterium]|nr:cardiolipin synthase [Usitatibacteraceae bacterium]
MSTTQSKAILVRMQKGGVPTDIFDRHLANEEGIVDSPLVIGNKALLLRDGPATFQAMFGAIRAAKDHVHMETYLIEDDEVGNKFADELVAKQAQGVQVSLIYDSVGALAAPRSFFERLTRGGVRVLEFNPVNPLAAKMGWDLNRRDHRKLLIVDGSLAFVGGINISSVYSSGSFGKAVKRHADGSPPWRDTHLQIEGPVVAEFQKLFLESWDKQRGDPLPAYLPFPPLPSRGNEVIRAIGSTPDAPSNLIHRTLLSAIDSADTSVHLTNAYFVPDPQLMTALLAAAARGVDVRLILPGATDFWLVFHAGRSHYSQLLQHGVKIHERQGALLHAKTAVIDGVWSTIGSSNMDWRSLLHNDEIAAVILGRDFGAQMQAMFAADLAQSTEVTLQAWRERPLVDRARELAAILWRYWL